MSATRPLVAACLAFVFAALPGCKKESAPVPSNPAEKAAAQSATATPSISPASVPGSPLNAAPVNAAPGTPPASITERKAEITRLVGELPAESKGADTAEAAARAFVEAAAKGDFATVKTFLISTADVKSFAPADKLQVSLERVARVLYKIKKPLGTVEVLGFEAGQMKEVKAGERGFITAVTVMMRAKVKARVNGKERTLTVRSLVKMGDRWKVAEL